MMDLPERKRKILQAIIRTYLETGEPVGSRTISKYTDLNLSSATIRNEMSDLEEMGLIIQPHTSAGRIPSDAGYRLYDHAALEALQQILLYRELEFPLGEIRQMMQSPAFDRQRALEQQVRMLQLKKERIEKLISLANELMTAGGEHQMDFSAFDSMNLDEYAAQARASWGGTEAWREYERKAKDRTGTETRELSEQLMQIFAAFGTLRGGDPAAEEAQELVLQLQRFISDHFYACTDNILLGLGQMYVSGGEMTQNIDGRGGEGTAEFVNRAIRAHCGI